jgi:uncharacterized protein
MVLKEKERKLKNLLSPMKKVLVAFSGGVDSSFLLYFAREALGAENVLAVIAQSPTYPREEVEDAIRLADALGIRCQLIKTEEFSDENFICNSTSRCYYCKKELFSQLKKLAAENGIHQVLDGSNFDDLSDYRPGSRAKNELDVRSPLQEAGLSKDDIRQLSKQAELSTWDKPSMACLSSRIPYGTRITPDILYKIGEAEKFLKSLGLKQVRVRHHDLLARIEVEGEEINRILQDGLRKKITDRLEELGYTYVALDLKGYRTGSMNDSLSG